MSEVNRGIDALGVFLSGGSTNTDPSASLGGVASDSLARGMGAIIEASLPAIRVDNVWPACGEGDATLQVDLNGNLVFTPPGGTAGTPVVIAAGETKIVSGVDTNKSIKVFRESGLALPVGGVATLSLLNALHGGFSMSNVTDAQRLAGVTTYRALMLRAQGPLPVQNIRIWTPAVVGLQSSYELATEITFGNTIQTVVDELTAPTAVSFASAPNEGAALTIASLTSGSYIGLWIKKIFPVGTVNVQEDVQLSMKYKGA